MEILLKTVGLNFLFLKLELTFTFFLFIFLFSFWPRCFYWRLIENVDEIEGCLRKGCGFLKQKKEISNPFQLFFCFKNPHSFLDLILWVLKITFWSFLILWYRFSSDFQYLQKQWKNDTECDGAVAQASVWFFICLLGCFWLL